MKELFKLAKEFAILFGVLLTFIVITTHIIGTSRHPWSVEALIDLVLLQSAMIIIYAVSSLGIYVCNTWVINRIKQKTK